MNEPMILLVEDSKKVQAVNKMEFEERGYRVRLAFTLAEAREAVRRETPGLIILDINMPDGDGLSFLREYRTGGADALAVPVLMLTGYGEDKDVVRGFESGCNDYLAKPYTFPVLLMRAKELLNRAARIPKTLQKGSLKLDIVSGQAFCNGLDLLLTQKEFALLLLLVQSEDITLSAETLYEKVWKAPIGNDKNAVQVTISKLRKKIEPTGYDISVIRGQGYVFENI